MTETLSEARLQDLASGNGTTIIPSQEETVSLAAELIGHRLRVLAQSYLDREDEDWTWVDPEDVKLLARAVLARK